MSSTRQQRSAAQRAYSAAVPLVTCPAPTFSRARVKVLAARSSGQLRKAHDRLRETETTLNLRVSGIIGEVLGVCADFFPTLLHHVCAYQPALVRCFVAKECSASTCWLGTFRPPASPYLLVDRAANPYSCDKPVSSLQVPDYLKPTHFVFDFSCCMHGT